MTESVIFGLGFMTFIGGAVYGVFRDAEQGWIVLSGGAILMLGVLAFHSTL